MSIRYCFLTILLCMLSTNIFCSVPAAAQSSCPPGGASISSLPNVEQPKMKRLALLDMTTTKLASGELVKRFKLTIPSKGEWCSRTVTITPARGESLDHRLVATVNDYDRYLERDCDPSLLHMATICNTGSGPLKKDCQVHRVIKRSNHLNIFANQILMLQALPSDACPQFSDSYQLKDLDDAQKRYQMKKISLLITEAKGETYISDDEDEQ